MRTKEIEIEFPAKGKLVVTMKRLNAGEMHRLQDEATDIKVVNGQPQARVLMSVIREAGVLKSLVSAKDAAGITIAIGTTDIQSLDPEDFEKMYDAFTELNSVDVKKND